MPGQCGTLIYRSGFWGRLSIIRIATTAKATHISSRFRLVEVAGKSLNKECGGRRPDCPPKPASNRTLKKHRTPFDRLRVIGRRHKEAAPPHPLAVALRLCVPSTGEGQALPEKIERTAPGGYGDTSANPQISDFPTPREPGIQRGWPFRLRSLIA